MSDVVVRTTEDEALMAKLTVYSWANRPASAGDPTVRELNEVWADLEVFEAAVRRAERARIAQEHRERELLGLEALPVTVSWARTW